MGNQRVFCSHTLIKFSKPSRMLVAIAREHGQRHVPSYTVGCMQIATQSSDEEELYAALGPGAREGQNGADAPEADAVEAQVSLLCALLNALVLHICKLVGVGLRDIDTAHLKCLWTGNGPAQHVIQARDFSFFCGQWILRQIVNRCIQTLCWLRLH